jgi:hypothetical protein
MVARQPDTPPENERAPHPGQGSEAQSQPVGTSDGRQHSTSSPAMEAQDGAS